jgi:hypothetical protein
MNIPQCSYVYTQLPQSQRRLSLMDLHRGPAFVSPAVITNGVENILLREGAETEGQRRRRADRLNDAFSSFVTKDWF